MNVTNLKPGTKLMWDAPEPYGGYAKERYNRDDNRVMYPCIVSPHVTNNSFLNKNCILVTTGRTSNWMGPEEEWLREPTAEELKSIKWPTMKLWPFLFNRNGTFFPPKYPIEKNPKPDLENAVIVGYIVAHLGLSYEEVCVHNEFTIYKLKDR